ncbi:hypothetical protein MesoLjLa_69450 (plasmid) [Mesorhizobium sp. L-2-11]|nr:hypothetical protein MesoLjLa_69450 [Mesorhizobium sp. L-2-11]
MGVDREGIIRMIAISDLAVRIERLKIRIVRHQHVLANFSAAAWNVLATRFISSKLSAPSKREISTMVRSQWGGGGSAAAVAHQVAYLHDPDEDHGNIVRL